MAVSGGRVAFNNLFIIDPLFTLPMLVALVWLAFLRTKKQLPKRRKLNAWGLGIATAYALLSIGMKFVASAGFEADLARRGTVYQRRMEAPTPFNILLWRSVVDRGDELWVGYRSVFETHDAGAVDDLPERRGGARGAGGHARSEDARMVHRRVVDRPAPCQGGLGRRSALRRIEDLGRKERHGGQPDGLCLGRDASGDRATGCGRFPPTQRCLARHCGGWWRGSAATARSGRPIRGSPA